ncbi:MAG: D-alanine--D-alanine ligase [Pseudomonadota bacterium]
MLHLFGSPTNAFWADLSLTYARGAYEALSPHHSFLNVLILPDGSWRVGRDIAPGTLRETASPFAPDEAVSRILSAAPDCALPQMFCPAGMTDYRGMIEALGIPIIGNTGAVMALAADKAKTRAIMQQAGIAVPRAQLLGHGDTEPPDLSRFAPPFIVKPAIADNSEGVSLVTLPEDLPAALRGAFAVCERVLIEDYIWLGREVRCGVVEIDGRAVPLPLEEYNVDPVVRPIRTPTDKLDTSAPGDVKLMAKTKDAAWIVPESDPLTQSVQRVALDCHAALGARDYSLFDFRIDRDGRPWFLEAGPYCSFSPDSVLAVMMDAAGTPLPHFFAQARDQATARRTPPSPLISNTPERIP